jgi:hypothetical protein
MLISEMVAARVPTTAALPEVAGAIDGFIEEVKAEEGYEGTDEGEMSTLAKGVVADLVACRVIAAGIDVYKDEIADESAEDVRSVLREKINYLKQMSTYYFAEAERKRSRLGTGHGTSPPTILKVRDD